MIDIDLEDAGQRALWAEDDGKSCYDIIEDFRKTNPYNSWLHQEGDRWYWRFLRIADAETEFNTFVQASRLFGSFLDHMRASLNYLTYQLALLSERERPGFKGNPRPDRVEFPIFNCEQVYVDSNAEVKKLPDEYRLRLEAVQPYKGGHEGLWMLHQLAREYRHRLVHLLACYPFGEHEGLFSESLPPSANDIEIAYKGGALKHGDELASFTTSTEFDPNMYPRPVISVGLDHPACEGVGVVSVMTAIRVDIFAVLNDWAGEPPGTA